MEPHGGSIGAPWGPMGAQGLPLAPWGARPPGFPGDVPPWNPNGHPWGPRGFSEARPPSEDAHRLPLLRDLSTGPPSAQGGAFCMTVGFGRSASAAY